MTGPLPDVWVLVAGITVISLTLRASFILGIEWLDGLPPGIERVIPYVPPVVFAALAAPGLFLVDGALALQPGNERLFAGLLAFAVARYTENMLVTVGIGMTALWVLLWL